jgi:transcriptional regulator NrdR family protein
MAMKLKVRKRSGAIEHFKPEKLERSILGAGSSAGAAFALALSVAKEVVKEVAGDITHHAEEGVVPSHVIRRHVIASLKKRHPKMAHAYAKYKKKKSK